MSDMPTREMKILIIIALLALSTCVSAQSVEDLAALDAARERLRAAQVEFDAARKVVVDTNAEAVRNLNVATDAATITKLRADVDAMTAQIASMSAMLAAHRAAAQTALDGVGKATTILGLRAPLVIYLQSEAKP